jgi:hypothetical protein
MEKLEISSTVQGGKLSQDASLESQEELNKNNSSTLQTVFLIISLTSLTLVNSFVLGLLTIGLPKIAVELDIPDNLLLW